MSGGAVEYVMGNYNNTANTTYFPTLPSSKYYDVYSGSMSACTLATCGGHALNETKKWYGDYASFVFSSYPWFFRGGLFNDGQIAGAFDSDSSSGDAYYHTSWRGVVVAR